MITTTNMFILFVEIQKNKQAKKGKMTTHTDTQGKHNYTTP